MKYLVTGSSGFIGYYLTNELAKKKDNYIYALDKNYCNFDKKNIQEITHDLKIPFDNFPKVDFVIHLAAYNGTKWFYKKPFDVIKDNIIPTINLLEFYKNYPLKRFIYAGSPESTVVATENFNYKIPTDENCPIGVSNVLNKRWSYANSKALGEQAVIASNLNFAIIRYNNVYGPRQIDHFISEFYERAKKGKYELYGYDNTRTFIYIDDAIKATKLIIESNDFNNEIFNVGGEDEKTIKSVAQEILDLMGIKSKIKLFKAPEGSTKRRCPDITKLKRITGFEQETSLIEGLKKTLNL